MKHIFFAVLVTAAAPCLAEVNDQASAMTALSSSAAKDRLDAIRYLGAQRTPEAYAALAAHFSSEKDAYLRVKTVELLDVSGSTAAYACAAAAADDANKAVRAAAAVSIAPLAGRAQADKKLKALAKDPDEAVRLSLVNALSVQPSTSSVAIIGTTLTDKKGPLRARQAAAEALTNMNIPAASEELIKHLSDPDPRIKAAALKGKEAAAKNKTK